MAKNDRARADARTMPVPMERLRLASLILDDLTASPGQGFDISDHWNEQDLSDLAAFSAKHAEQSPTGENSHA